MSAPPVYNKQIENFTFSSDNQFVLLDSSVINSPEIKPKSCLPMTFSITYNDQAPEPPKLTFLINPSSISFSYSKKVNSSFARGGFVTEEWGENQSSISCSGKIGAYYVWNPEKGYPGLNRFDRSNSMSYQNLLQLLMIYRNNGMIYQQTSRSKTSPYAEYKKFTAQFKGVDSPQKLIQSINNTNSGYSVQTQKKMNERNFYTDSVKRASSLVSGTKNRIDRLGDLTLYYDRSNYVGSFDSLTIEEDASSPFNLSYSFNFIVQKISTDDLRP